MAKNTDPPPQRPASREAPPRSVGPLRGRGGRRGLPFAAFEDPVDEWKREALASVGAGGQRRPKLTLRLRLGFILVVMAAGAPFGVIGWAVALSTFLSVSLVQELPGVLAARAMHRSARAVLSASGSQLEIDGPPLDRLTAAWLVVGGALGNLGVALALAQSLGRGVLADRAASIVAAAAFVHGVWGAGQLLPLPPFRAGQAIARRLRPPLRLAYAAVAFVALAVAGLWALRAPGLPPYFLVFVLTLVASTSVLREAFNALRDHQSGVAVMTAAATKLLGEDQPERAAEMAKQGLANAMVESNRLPLCQIVAWAAIANRDPFTAHGALLRLPPAARDLHLVTAYLACCGRVDEAIALLQQSRARGQRARETSKLLIDLLFQAGKLAHASRVIQADRLLLGPDDMTAIDATGMLASAS